MRKKFCAVIPFLAVLLMCFVPVADAAPRLVWDASTGQVDGYKVYYTDGTNQYQKIVTMPECPLADLNLEPGKSYTFWVTAYNTAGESGSSNTVAYDVAEYTPGPDVLPPVTIIIPGPVTITINTN